MVRETKTKRSQLKLKSKGVKFCSYFFEIWMRRHLTTLPLLTHTQKEKKTYDSQKFWSSNLTSKFYPIYIVTFLKIGKLKSNFHPHTHWRKHNTIHTETPTTPHPPSPHTHIKKGAAFPPVHKWKTKDFYMDWDSTTKDAPLPAKIKRVVLAQKKKSPESI